MFHRHFGREDFEVLVLTSSKRRLEALRTVAGRVVPNDRRGDYFLATFAVLAPLAFAAATWVDLDGERYDGVLLDA